MLISGLKIGNPTNAGTAPGVGWGGLSPPHPHFLVIFRVNQYLVSSVWCNFHMDQHWNGIETAYSITFKSPFSRLACRSRKLHLKEFEPAQILLQSTEVDTLAIVWPLTLVNSHWLSSGLLRPEEKRVELLSTLVFFWPGQYELSSVSR